MEATIKPKIYQLLDKNGQVNESQEPGALGGNRKSKIYGRLDCPAALRDLDRGYSEIRVFFANEEDAIAAGYRPCRTCMHDKYRQWKNGGEPGSADYPWKVAPKQN